MPVRCLGFNLGSIPKASSLRLCGSRHSSFAPQFRRGPDLTAAARLPIVERRFRLEWLCEIEALPAGATKGCEGRRELDRLNAFGRRRHAESVCKAEDRAHDGHAVRIDHHSGDEASIDLENVDRETLQIGEAGI